MTAVGQTRAALRSYRGGFGGQRSALTAVLAQVLAYVREELAEQMPKTETTIAALEYEVRTLRAEQKKLAGAVATARDVPQLVDELRKRSVRLRAAGVELTVAKRTPDDMAKLMTRVEASATSLVAELRKTLARSTDLRRIFLSLFSDGIKLFPDEPGSRQVWKIEARPDLGQILGGGFRTS